MTALAKETQETEDEEDDDAPDEPPPPPVNMSRLSPKDIHARLT